MTCSGSSLGAFKEDENKDVILKLIDANELIFQVITPFY